MKNQLAIKLILTSLMFCSCKKKITNNYNENDFYKTQGLVIKVNKNFNNFEKKFSNNYVYAYRLDLSIPLIGYADSEFILKNHEPLVIMVNKKDSLDSFIAYRGILDKKRLTKFKGELKID
ncbi:hypothetical protein ACFSKN_03340 [Mariniflexile gromovii]|uniref:Lipoprotein n=1 Tax=Mariniflexile gromovii TaxID=362523 RepID=A0ABS4BT62_9FLAO|nr:hypothetical protein [Mariniflexile gromovii]MBP0903598.1 hypothetical protein [Mariniflexile gromovii]